MGRRSVLGGYDDPAVWTLVVPGILSDRGSPRPGRRHLQSRGMDLVVGGYFPSTSWLDPGDGISSLSLGQLQRTDDDVPAGSGLHFLSPSRGNLDRMEASCIRV